MKLYHVSEESNIEVFRPIKPYRRDMKDSPPLVWAINERCLSNFLTPRDCPRVTYHVGENTTEADLAKYFSSTESKHVVAIECGWYEEMRDKTLYLYEFDSTNFYLQDDIAGYYVSQNTEIPINKIVVDDLFKELFSRKVEVRLLPELHNLCKEIQQSSLNWSMCRMENAIKKE